MMMTMTMPTSQQNKPNLRALQRRNSLNDLRQAKHSQKTQDEPYDPVMKKTKPYSSLFPSMAIKIIPLLVIMFFSILRLASLLRIIPTADRWTMEISGPTITSLLRTTTPASAFSPGAVFFRMRLPSLTDSESSLSKQRLFVQQQLRQVQNYLPNVPIHYDLATPIQGGGQEQDMLRKYWHDVVSITCSSSCTALPSSEDRHTLQQVWDYCQENPNDVVTYINNGKAGDDEQDEKAWRHEAGTMAALQCHGNMRFQQQTIDQSGSRHQTQQCTSCGLSFQTRPSFQHVTNQWTAPCSYVQKLVPPQQYTERLERMYHLLATEEDFKCLRPHNISYSPNLLRPHVLGVAEQKQDSVKATWPSRWIHSHASLQPCDMLPSEVWNFQQELNHSIGSSGDGIQAIASLPWSLALAPSESERFNVRGAPTSWQRLDGRLFEWEYINQHELHMMDSGSNHSSSSLIVPDETDLLPANDSWVYRYYENAQFGIKCYKNYLSNEFL